MANILPISLEILTCFTLSTTLLTRYCDMVNSNIVTVVAVFVSWFFSFVVIFLLPTDLTSTAYRQCLLDHAASTNITPSSNVTTIATHIAPDVTTNRPINLSHIGNISSFIPQHTILSRLAQGNETTNITNPCVTPWNYVTESVLTKLWRFIYWTSQFLTWILMPIMQSYSMAGEFTTRERLKSAIRSNIIYYSSFGAIFSVLLIYVVFTEGLDFASLKVIAISSSNTWGLLLLVVLLGYGLVELPRHLMNRSKHSKSLNRLYFKVARVNAEKCEAEEKLDDVLEEIHLAYSAIGSNETSPLRKHLDKIVGKCPPDWKKRSSAFRRQAAASNSTYDQDQIRSVPYDIETLTRLHKRVIHAVQRHRQACYKWNYTIEEVIEWEDVAKNQSENCFPNTRREFKSTLPKVRSIIHAIYTPFIEWYWKCLIRVWLLKVTSVTMAILSIAVVWSEIAFPISFFSPKFGIFAFFVDSFEASQEYFYLELFSVLSIGYLAICAFYTVFHMKIFNVYYLSPNGQTDEYSLLFSGMLICRLTAPLCLNYLCLAHRDSHIVKRSSSLETSFTTIMGHLDLIPIVNNGLNIILPLCISIICSAIYFNFGSKLLHNFGFEQFVDDDEMTMDYVQTGRDLVKRETSKLLRNFESSTTSYHQMPVR